GFGSGGEDVVVKVGRARRSTCKREVEYLLLGGGALEQDYRATAPVTILKQSTELSAVLQHLRERGFSSAIVNTTASGAAVELLAQMGIRTVALVHELPRL